MFRRWQAQLDGGPRAIAPEETTMISLIAAPCSGRHDRRLRASSQEPAEPAGTLLVDQQGGADLDHQAACGR